MSIFKENLYLLTLLAHGYIFSENIQPVVFYSYAIYDFSTSTFCVLCNIYHCIWKVKDTYDNYFNIKTICT